MGMADDVIEDLRGRIAKTLEDLKLALAKVRTGRANPALLDGVRVDYYGTMSPLQQVSNVTVADPRLIVVKPWEKSMITVIEKAINAAGLGVNAMSDAEIVRVPIPPLTEERRREYVKIVKQKGEEHKIAIRNERRDAQEMIEELVKGGDLAEDEGKKALAAVQAEVDAGIKKVDDTIAGKEKDLMQV
jgi:ribosome recycling factor